MITGPDRNRHHRIISALSLLSCRAAGGLRRPSESQALLAFPRLSLPAGCVGPTSQRPFDRDYASMQRRPEDPKGMYIDAGSQGSKMDSFDIILMSKQISAVKGAFTYIPAQLEKERRPLLTTHTESPSRGAAVNPRNLFVRETFLCVKPFCAPLGTVARTKYLLLLSVSGSIYRTVQVILPY